MCTAPSGPTFAGQPPPSPISRLVLSLTLCLCDLPVTSWLPHLQVFHQSSFQWHHFYFHLFVPCPSTHDVSLVQCHYLLPLPHFLPLFAVPLCHPTDQWPSGLQPCSLLHLLLAPPVVRAYLSPWQFKRKVESCFMDTNTHTHTSTPIPRSSCRFSTEFVSGCEHCPAVQQQTQSRIGLKGSAGS